VVQTLWDGPEESTEAEKRPRSCAGRRTIADSFSSSPYSSYSGEGAGGGCWSLVPDLFELLLIDAVPSCIPNVENLPISLMIRGSEAETREIATQSSSVTMVGTTSILLVAERMKDMYIEAWVQMGAQTLVRLS
jgi:hypothetical protein